MKHMKKTLLAICLLLAIPLTINADTISVKSDEWCPFNCEPGSANPGYMIEIARIIFEKAGHQLTYGVMPWSRCIDHGRKGKLDALPGATKGEMPDFVFPEEELGFSMTAFFVKKGNQWRYTDLSSLEGLKVGVLDEYEYGAGLDEYFEKKKNTGEAQIVRGEDPVGLNIKKLLKGRIDIVPEDKLVFLYNAKEHGVLDQVQEAGMVPVTDKADFESTKVYLAFSPKNPRSKEYARILSEGIREMRASGELAKILAKYGLTDWKDELLSLKKELGL